MGIGTNCTGPSLTTPMFHEGHGETVECVLQAAAVTNAAISRVEELQLQEESFRKLLLAMYNRPYNIECLNELRIITNLANFYYALLILSGTITGALLGSPLFNMTQLMNTAVSCKI